METSGEKSAKNGELLAGVSHQGRDNEGKRIPWEPWIENQGPRNDWSRRHLAVTKIA